MPTIQPHTPSTWTWQSRAQCRGTDAELFFPSPEGDPAPAKAVCADCPVRLACLGFALEHGEKYGIWGGTTERERARISAAERDRLVADGRKVAREQPAA